MTTHARPAPPAGHSLSAASALRAMRDWGGGRTLVVLAEPAEDGGFPAGLRRPPATTALEAVLSYGADGRGYDRVVVGSGVNRRDTGNHLPARLTVGDGLLVGKQAGMWELRGPRPSEPATRPTAAANGSEEYIALAQGRVRRSQDSLKAGRPGRVLARFDGNVDWVAQALEVLAQLYAAIGFRPRGVDWEAGPAPPARRTLLVLDEDLLVPRPDQLRKALETADRSRVQIEVGLSDLPDRLLGTTADLVLLVRSRASLGSLVQGRMIHDQAIQLSPEQIAQSPDRLNLPQVKWRPDSFQRVELRAHDPTAPFSPHLPRHPRSGTVQEALRHVPPQKPAAARPRPVADPTAPDLSFWSRIDVDGLETLLTERVIGQRHVVRDVVTRLARFRQTCRDALAQGMTRFPCDPGEKPRRSHRPPVLMFTGESGMGKTYIGELVAGFLFGDSHYELIPLTQMNMADELLGVRMGYVGCGTRKKFHEYAHRTGGLGLVVFDELDKVSRENNQGLDDAVAPFLSPLEHWSYVPNNTGFANAGDLRIHFANSIIVFTGNFLDDHEPARPGYKRLSDLGAPFLGRLSGKLRFGVIESDEIPAAVAFFIRKYCRQQLQDVFVTGEVAIDPAVVARLAAEFDSLTAGHPALRTFRVLEGSFLPTRLPEDRLKDKFRRQDLTVTSDDLGDPWHPAGEEAE